MIVAICFNLLDLISGIISGVKNKEISSSKLRDGLFKKVGFLLVYAFGYLVEFEAYKFGMDSMPVLQPILIYAIGTEIVSILENIHKINNAIIPEKILEFFKIDG